MITRSRRVTSEPRPSFGVVPSRRSPGAPHDGVPEPAPAAHLGLRVRGTQRGHPKPSIPSRGAALGTCRRRLAEREPRSRARGVHATRRSGTGHDRPPGRQPSRADLDGRRPRRRRSSASRSRPARSNRRSASTNSTSPSFRTSSIATAQLRSAATPRSSSRPTSSCTSSSSPRGRATDLAGRPRHEARTSTASVG